MVNPSGNHLGLGVLHTLLLMALTALMELLGCYLPYLWLHEGRSALLLIPAATGRVYAAYGAVYVSMAVVWLRLVDGVVPNGRDLFGVAVVLAGLAVLISGGSGRR